MCWFVLWRSPATEELIGYYVTATDEATAQRAARARLRRFINSCGESIKPWTHVRTSLDMSALYDRDKEFGE